MESVFLEIKGIVQGVGFRPFVYRTAREMSVRGFVSNTADGVIVRAEAEDLAAFLEKLRIAAPPLASITDVAIVPVEPEGFTGFEIRGSSEEGGFTLLSPDVAVCDDCRRELFDPSDRRYLYPFINCTNCGPRYTITESVPYDRPATTMKSFAMCSRCSAEYHDPLDRRFHAQPNACPACGPSVVLVRSSGEVLDAQEPLAACRRMLAEGGIVAVKGIGGFHLACDALNSGAVERLRDRKRRSNKPFGLMAAEMAVIARHCRIAEHEQALLNSPRRPIVLLERLVSSQMPEAVAPQNSSLGFMLPYTPLHALLLQYPDGLDLSVLVMTSGNLSEEPIISENDEALARLSGICDAFLMHNRGIFTAVDDSVARVFAPEGRAPGRVSFIRRSRGYAPEPILLSSDGPDVLGCGADLKNTFTVLKSSCAIVSQHIGDMENLETLLFFEETLRNITDVYRAEPQAIAYDLHPGYFSSRWARELETDVPKLGLQHHYSHVMSVAAEHGLEGMMLGIAFDGTGYGEDGTLWGGEFLVANATGYRRVGHLRQIGLPGGEKAVREPWRTAVSCLLDAAGKDALPYLRRIGFTERYGEKTVADVMTIAGNREFSPLSSGAGRVFDAVSAMLGICDRNTFEGEAAMALESAADISVDAEYPMDITFRDPMEVDLSLAFLAIAEDLARGIERMVIAAKFQNTVAAAVVRVAQKLSLVHNCTTVAVSGGVFQNARLSAMVMEGLRMAGLRPFTNERVPCNDAGISLGQAYSVRERLKKGLL